MAAVFAGAGSVTAMAETADAATVETQAESQAAKPAPTEFAHITSCEVTGGNQVASKVRWKEAGRIRHTMIIICIFLK